MLVSDYATGEIIIYDISSVPANEIGRIETGAEGIMGINIGPEGLIWYVDYDANTVNRISFEDLTAIPQNSLTSINIYPNPSSSSFKVQSDFNGEVTISIYDYTGKIINETTSTSKITNINSSSWSEGIYTVVIKTNRETITRKVTIMR